MLQRSWNRPWICVSKIKKNLNSCLLFPLSGKFEDHTLKIKFRDQSRNATLSKMELFVTKSQCKSLTFVPRSSILDVAGVPDLWKRISDQKNVIYKLFGNCFCTCNISPLLIAFTFLISKTYGKPKWCNFFVISQSAVIF